MDIKNILKINRLVIIFTILIGLSCKKTETVTTNNKAVVESYLQYGEIASVKISKQIPINGDSSSSTALTNLQVSITYNGNIYKLLHTENGIYTNSTMPLVSTGSYSLQFTYEGVPVSAITTIPEKPTNYEASDTIITLPFFWWRHRWRNTNHTRPYKIDLEQLRK